MNSRRGAIRAGWFLIGLVLWGAVFVSLFRVWQQRTADDESSVPQGELNTEVATVETTGGKPDASGDETTNDEEDAFNDLYDENGRPKKIEVKLTWPESGVADFSFTDRSGRKISKNDLLGKPWVAGFIFIQCAGPCPKVSLAMQTIQKRYDDKPVNIVTFTVDPKRDTPEALAKYADFYQADPEQWFFLTGERDDLYGLINGSFLMPVKEDEKPKPGFEIIHTTNLCLVDATGRVVGKYNSVKDEDMALLRRDLDRLIESLPETADENPSTEPDQPSPPATSNQPKGNE